MSVSDNTKKKNARKPAEQLNGLTDKFKNVAGSEASADQNSDAINMLLVEGIRPVIFDWNLDTGQATTSDSASEYVLFDSSVPDVFENRVSEDAVHADDRKRLVDEMQICIKKKSPRFEITLRLKKKTGIYAICRVTITYFMSDTGKLRRAIGTIRELNITDASADIQLQALTSYMAAGVMMVEAKKNGRLSLLYTSESYFRMTGLTKQELSRYELEPTKIIDPFDYGQLVLKVERSAKRNEVLDFSYRANYNGMQKWHHVRAVKIPYDKSEFPVFIAVITDITELKERETELRLANDRMNLAFSLLNTSIFEIDLETRSLTLWEPFDDYKISVLAYDNFDSTLISEGLIHPDSVKEFKEYVRALFKGAKSGSYALIIRNSAGQYVWSKLSYRVVFDEAGRPIKAVGTSEKLPNIVDERTIFQQECLLETALRDKLFSVARANLTKNRVDVFFFEGDDRLSLLSDRSVSELIRVTEKGVFGEEDKYSFTKKFAMKSLVTSYEKGNHWFSFDYKRKDRAGKIKWYSILAHLISDPLTGDLYAFVYTLAINEIKEFELALPQKVEHDSNAMVYTKESVKIFVSNLVDTEKERNRLCAFLLIDINGINQIKENVGINVASRIISLIGRLFKLLFDNTGVVGRMRDDRFAIFLPSVLSASDAELRSKEIINTIQTCVIGADVKESIDFSVGISVLSYNDATFSTLYDSADSALEHNKRQLKGNQFALFDAQKEYSDEASFLILSEGRFIEKEFTVNSNRHDETMLTSFFNCASHLANATDTDAAMKGVLEETAKYYKCDRIYILDIAKDNKTVNGLHEWRKSMYRPTLDLTKNVPISKLPAVKKAYDTLHTIILQSVNKQSEETTSEKTFIASPVMKNGKVVGFICIDNPTKHNDDIALIYSLSSLLSVLRNLKHTEPENQHFDFDPQTKLLNRTRYWRDVTTIVPDKLSSLGVAFADVNGLNVLNKLHGTEFGDGIIMFVSGELREVFGGDNVYRISGDEFVALAKNIGHEEFNALTEKLRTGLEFTHPGTVSIGSTWSDSDINALKMVDHAESLMHLEKQEHYRREEDIGSRERPKILRSLQQSINDGMYRVYLQPKADIETGRIVGAEALVRLFDESKGIVSPDKFIPLFEREQVIKHIDFFVLERTLKILDGWRKAGKRILPVSVNFSRDTLLDPSSLAYALDVFSRYDIPLEMIEIEITESIGNIERATVSNACEQFIKQGFQLSLDDFGSEYSSLSVLSAIRFRSLKLDKSIISDIVTNRMSKIIVENTIRLCRETNMISVAEGVETAEQLNTLKELGCLIAQGYYFNKPIPPEDFEEKYISF